MKLEIGPYEADGKTRKVMVDIIDDDLYDLRNTIAIILRSLLIEFLISSPRKIKGISKMIGAFDILVNNEPLNDDNQKEIKKGLKQFSKQFLKLWW